MMERRPVVSVVTPVYNGGKFLVECIESVLAQGWTDFEYIILDNASTDDTAEIAFRYAATDDRVRVVRNDRTLPIIENWNKSVELMSGEARYLKVLHADDFMYPHCLERMVDLASRHPSVGVVGSLRQRGDRIQCDGLPPGREVFSGVEVTRWFLKGEVWGFAPTSGLLRGDLVRKHRPFYPTEYLHADLASYFQLLDTCDFGFIDEILCFSRTHDASVTTTVAEKRQTLLREWLPLLRRYGPRYFTERELAELEEAHLRRYYRVLVRSMITRSAEDDFLEFHLSSLRALGRAPGTIDLGKAVAAEIAASVANPGKVVKHLRNSLARR